MTYKAIHGQTPEYLTDKFVKVRDRTNQQTRSVEQDKLKSTQTKARNI